MTCQLVLSALLSCLVLFTTFAQADSSTEQNRAISLDFKGPVISNVLWGLAHQKKTRSAQLQASIVDDGQLEFARLMMVLKTNLRCNDQERLSETDNLSIKELTQVEGRNNTYETQLSEHSVKALTGAKRFSDACYRLEAQDSAGNLSFQWIPSPSDTLLSGSTSHPVSMPEANSRSWSKRWITVAAVTTLVALLAASASSGDDGGSEGSADNTLHITAPVP